MGRDYIMERLNIRDILRAQDVTRWQIVRAKKAIGGGTYLCSAGDFNASGPSF